MKTIYTPTHRLHATDSIWLDGVRFESKEVPARAEQILTAVTAAGFGSTIAPRDHGLAAVTSVHDAAYVRHLQTVYARYVAKMGNGRPVLSARTAVDPQRSPERPADFAALLDYYTYDYEEPILAGTWEAAYWSAQVALTAVDLVLAGERVAYALCRPPGHHATMDQYGGFCYLNNAAVAARALSAEGRVAIVDVDYHHGNGTQTIFYEDPGVYYVSLHADPALDYPYYWGYADERGSGAGRGTNLNLPLPLGVEDVSYLSALDEALEAVNRFQPAYMVVSMGLDPVVGDTIGKFHLTLAGWAEVGCRVAALGYPAVIVQEGGYRLEHLGRCAVAFLAAFVQPDRMELS